ncbi:MAG: hypothetical protein A2487_14605 [Candidatus Raymondbacteria bacterium RifOxyC12_full_50_8]|uniref:Uncharacterized protein n=1 Tax=Candidatus Raymondbacteria bacterium RIFOXYD12_FULL_49_13 TaxID=1817890 RepID=A0A1F7F650_UNCRA|nr:MAG: hypothetical protein A2248_03555 [Candidatus Raymondbacteria bacterium RIFOXYA2_FULL_49_16]OGJ99654.1 MAG: hypothetical protein A2350_16210 [Candidatus Raymondbacteria bacterium RifOxyB12_full_50_8]OGK02145.1 MAG: hypothetical protein A2519_18970 [Candidatus Raymondbacteria bacterium RIFOXYD12_FULL_49_13]OGK06871.1 MAG: hypothetical protein A2487_14605 [Candidatus Raymondbacteria bacterium RifOxyC12_full_50_8]OGP42530.1 MAG: hypothetical protein A2324_17590 [Candidatus Raymondbacteria b
MCHRDFTNSKSNEVAIYRDRIEIFNPGQFPFDYSPEDFIKGTEPSIPRNPLIAETLYRSEDIEKWGFGLWRISEGCKAAEVKVAFDKIKSGFMVIFYRPDITTSQTERNKGIITDSGKSSKVGLVEGLVENQKKMLELMTKNPNISKKELSENIGISTTAIDKNIMHLKKKSLLRRIGPDKGGHWLVYQSTS